MTSYSSPDDRSKALRWLGYGSELAKDLHGERASHRDAIWCLLCEAVQVVDRLPDQERRWLTSGTRSGGWNMVGMSLAELREIERIRLLSAMKPYDGSARVSPQSEAIDRALDILGWLNWCNVARMPQRLKKAAIALARGGDTDAVHRIYCPNRKLNRQNISEIKTRTIGFILTGLKNEAGIIPGEGSTFVEA